MKSRTWWERVSYVALDMNILDTLGGGELIDFELSGGCFFTLNFIVELFQT